MLIMNIPKNDDAELYGLFYRNHYYFLFLTYSFYEREEKKESDSSVEEIIHTALFNKKR